MKRITKTECIMFMYSEKYAKKFSPEKYRRFADILVETVGKDGISYENMLDRKAAELGRQEQYREYSEQKLAELAQDEVVAEMCETMLTDTNAAAMVSQRLYDEDRGLWGKIRDFFSGLVENLKKAYAELNPDSAIARKVKETVTGSEAVVNAWAEAVSDAAVNYQLQDGQKNNAREGVRFSMRENKDAVAKMESVAIVSQYEGSLRSGELIKNISAFFDSIGGAVENPELGSVILRKRGIKDDISHGIGREKAASFMAVPNVLSKGKVVDYQENWKGRGYDTAIVAAPIKISGENYLAGICVKRANGENKFYLHEVLQIKEGETPFNRAALNSSVDSGGETPSINSILSELLEVKRNIRYSSRTNQDSALTHLEKQNERLQQEMDYLRQLVKIQRTGNRDHVLDRNSVRKQAEKLMASANAQGNVDEISGLLNDFYHRMGTDAEITWDTMQEGAGEIADWLLEHHKPEPDEYAKSVLDFLKKRRVRINESQIGDIEYSYGYHAAGIPAAAEGVRKQ